MEELTRNQIEELKHDLNILLEEIRKAVESARSGSRPVDSGLPIGTLSRMDAIQQQHMAQAGVSSLKRRANQIAAALAAAASGTYGYCRRCEEPIGFKRLKARPETPLCVQCQAESEKKM